ncbi:hypothetical protein L2E82_16658 [Cichorium intybus]|uniref:Uncharacterized protein n=1 Tax=Cichorium intybus TaxID=13427 RepID=A0ACB9F669_CICIN|nr:hypothetical protein L2E82_16658 [Cichorium intybus]
MVASVLIIFIQIYLSINFSILALSSLVTGLEPLKFFYATSQSTYICIQPLQTLAYVLYLLVLLMYFVLVFSMESSMVSKLLGLGQTYVGFAVGLHYYMTVFHREVQRRGERKPAWLMAARKAKRVKDEDVILLEEQGENVHVNIRHTKDFNCKILSGLTLVWECEASAHCIIEHHQGYLYLFTNADKNGQSVNYLYLLRSHLHSSSPRKWENVLIDDNDLVIEDVDFCDSHLVVIVKEGERFKLCSDALPLPRNKVLWIIMEGDELESLQQFSPEVVIENPSAKNVVPLLPHIVLFHGTEDFSIPPDAR